MNNKFLKLKIKNLIVQTIQALVNFLRAAPANLKRCVKMIFLNPEKDF